MRRVVVDTDVVSFFIRRDTRARRFERQLTGAAPIICFQTAAELRRWVIRRGWGPRRLGELRRVLRSYSIHYPSWQTCGRWAALTDACARLGRSIPAGDAWIAATALELDAPLITHNRRHFEAVGGIELL